MILLVMASPLIRAEYSCKDNSNILIESKIIENGKVEKINDLTLGTASAKNYPFLEKSTADIFLNAKIVHLTNDTPSYIVEINSVDYEITMINSTDVEARIKVKGNTDQVTEGNYEKINSLFVNVISANGDLNPTTWTTKIMVGDKVFKLDTKLNPTEKIKINTTNYLVELVSSFDKSSSVNVYSCESEIKEIEDIESTTNETDEINETDDQINDTNVKPNENSEETKIDSNLSDIVEEVVTEGDKPSIFSNRNLFIIAAIVILLLFVIIFYFFKNKDSTNQEADSLIEDIVQRSQNKY